MIKGTISEKKVNNKSITYSLAGSIANKYSTYRDSIPKIHLFEDYSFEYVYSNLFNSNPFKLCFGVKKDILISLCFNPYFNEFYKVIKENNSTLTYLQKRLIYNGFLKYYSLKSTNMLMQTEKDLAEKDIQKIYLKYSAYDKCNELIDLFGMR